MLKMDITTIFKVCGAFFLLLIMPLELLSQEQPLDKKVSIDVQNMSLSEVLVEIEKKSGATFSYNPKKIPLSKKITYRANKSLNDILDDLMAQVGLQYVIVEEKLILKPQKKQKEEKKKKVSERFTVNGYIKDENTGEVLIGATVYVEELKTGAVSNVYGFYSLSLPQGEYDVAYSFIGYKPIIAKINTNSSSAPEDIRMSEESPVLEELVISSRPLHQIEAIQMSQTNLNPKTVTEMPALFGEKDVVKGLEAVPGIKLHSDGSTYYYVRGGDKDQNLVLIDDAPIYNPTHMLGFFSSIIPDAVNDITVYKGDMPTSLGGRLSSVMDIRTKKGNDKKFQVWGKVGLISSKLGVEGPLKKGRSSFLLSGRISRLQWLFKKADENIKQFHFFDLTGKVNFRLNEKNRMFFSFYSGKDEYSRQNEGIEWSNSTGTLRWNHTFSDRLFLNTTIFASVYDYFFHIDVANNSKWTSHIGNFSLKTDFSYFIKPSEVLTFGLAFGDNNFNPGNVTSDIASAEIPSLSIKNAREVVLYGSHELKLGERWGLKYGLRFTSWLNDGEAFEFVFDENKNPIDTLFFSENENYHSYDNLEPRVTVSHFISENSSIKASYARNVQNVHLISNSESPFTSLDVWLPSSLNLKPQIADQVAWGYFHFLPNAGVSLEAEVFYKEMSNQIDYTSHAQTLLNPLLESELVFGEAKAYGLELLAKKNGGRIRGWLGYSYSRAKRKFPDINNGQEYNAFYDRPHEINLVMSYDLSLRWTMGMNWNYYTGSPFSSPTAFYNFNGLETPIYGQRNNDRLPDYHRMDLSSTFKLNRDLKKNFQHSLTISIQNLYGRKNALFINYSKTETAEGEFKIPVDLLEPKRVTSQSYLFQFAPSIAYTFKFL